MRIKIKTSNRKQKRLLSSKITIVLTIIILVFQIFSNVKVNALEEEHEKLFQRDSLQKELLEEQIQSPEIKLLKKYVEEYTSEQMKDFLDKYSIKNMIEDVVDGKVKFSIKDFIKKSLALFMSEIYLNMGILANLFILAILCGILKNLQNSFLTESVGELAFFICYIVVVSLLIIGFKETSVLGIDAIEKMVGFMYATVPIMITLLVSGGSVVSGGIFQPILIMAVEISAAIIKNVFIPIIFVSSMLSIINNISDKIRLSKLAKIIKDVCIASIGIILTVFVGIVAVQGSVGAVTDGIASKTIKFAIGTFIPVVGGYLSEAADTVIGCSLIIKNAAGILVLIGIIIICLIPIIKIAAVAILYKIACALMEPLSEKRITDCISDVANSMLLIMGSVAVVAFMFIITITAIIASGNIAAMIR